ncbi:outer membrane autotransporter barrel domain protein, partial [Yersinia pestis PY-01]|jgi:hypothetical protein
MTAR